MRVEYKPNSKGQIIDLRSCSIVTGLSPQDILKLTGIQSIFSTHIIDPILFHGEYPLLRIVIEKDGITLDRKINFEKGSIENITMRIDPSRTGTGYKIFSAQVQFAAKSGLKLLKCTAAGNWETRPGLVGYIVWGKLGYIMTKNYQDSFLELMKKHNKDYQTLNTLLVKSKAEEEFWELNGNRWKGEFNLEEGSTSRTILENYKTSRGLLDN